jgi:hypothetical protein
MLGHCAHRATGAAQRAIGSAIRSARSATLTCRSRANHTDHAPSSSTSTAGPNVLTAADRFATPPRHRSGRRQLAPSRAPAAQSIRTDRRARCARSATRTSPWDRTLRRRLRVGREAVQRHGAAGAAAGSMDAARREGRRARIRDISHGGRRAASGRERSQTRMPSARPALVAPDRVPCRAARARHRDAARRGQPRTKSAATTVERHLRREPG